MEINSLGTAYYDNYRMGAALSGVAGVSGGENGESFDALLERAAAQNETGEIFARGGRLVINDGKDKLLYEQCVELEIFMVKTLINSMRDTVQKSGLIDEGFAGKMYEDMLYDEYARDFTKSASFGMAEMAYRELKGQRGTAVIRNN
ncbi:MAG: rod-binding protein [Treponema sp.]|jgi:flagellar protein FlgJ|nr:rod-binding protein [Treponema sp.]